MSDERDMCGSLGKNKDKKEDKHPDYRGKVKINGVTYKLAGWIKQSDKGPWLSLAVRPMEDKPKPPPPPGPMPDPVAEEHDTLPF